MADAGIRIRAATLDDLDVVGPMGGDLVRLHHGWDAQRFMLPDDVDEGFKWWFGRELENKRALILVAEKRGTIVGYVYATAASVDWNALLAKHVALHDIYVKESARKLGAARMLLDAVFEWGRKKKLPRAVLSTAVGNTRAHALFKAAGFRPTMIEMTREL